MFRAQVSGERGGIRQGLELQWVHLIERERSKGDSLILELRFFRLREEGSSSQAEGVVVGCGLVGRRRGLLLWRCGKGAVG